MGTRRLVSDAVMPELPEVEVQRRNLVRWLRGRRVSGAEAESSRVFRDADPRAFESLRGPLTQAERRGKYLLLTFGGRQGLLSHLGMTGKWLRRGADEKVPHSRARLRLDSGEVLHYRDPRQFGRLVPLPAEALLRHPTVAGLGPDPWVEGLTPWGLQRAVGDSRQALKVALMDQSRLAGLGNIHAAEALYRAHLHPARAPGTLSPAEWRALCRGIQAALDFALAQEQGEEIRYVEEPGTQNPFLVYGRAQERCRRCGAAIRSMTQAGRTTYYCPGCQPKGGRG